MDRAATLCQEKELHAKPLRRIEEKRKRKEEEEREIAVVTVLAIILSLPCFGDVMIRKRRCCLS
jgi:hypothetical protein